MKQLYNENGGKSILSIKNITKIYNKGSKQVQALDKVNFEINEGEMIAIMGASGSGKTSLLNIIGLLDDEYNFVVSLYPSLSYRFVFGLILCKG